MKNIFAFDVYGTLIDTHGMVTLLQQMIGDQAIQFSQQWRTKQLEYTFRRAAMGQQQYQDFNTCTETALIHTNCAMQTKLSDHQQQSLLAAYTELPDFTDAVPCLQQMNQQDNQCWAFSNGTYKAVNKLMQHAHLNPYLTGVYSVDPLKTYKPDPAVYYGFAELHSLELGNHQRLGQNCVLVSANPFDIIGAKAADWQTVWLQRHDTNVFDSWELQPDHTIHSLAALADLFL